MKATFTPGKSASDFENGKNLQGDKEQIAGYKVIGMVKGELDLLITVRAWMGRSRNASTVYASIWVHGDTKGANYRSGHGSAGGYGYHKLSAALGEAIGSAGIELSERIGGVGERAMEDALLAIAKAQGCRSKHLRVISM